MRALRLLDGHGRRAEAFVLYQQYGPAGPDGQRGTPDDVADPLQEL